MVRTKDIDEIAARALAGGITREARFVTPEPDAAEEALAGAALLKAVSPRPGRLLPHYGLSPGRCGLILHAAMKSHPSKEERRIAYA